MPQVSMKVPWALAETPEGDAQESAGREEESRPLQGQAPGKAAVLETSSSSLLPGQEGPGL